MLDGFNYQGLYQDLQRGPTRTSASPAIQHLAREALTAVCTAKARQDAQQRQDHMAERAAQRILQRVCSERHLRS